MGTKQGEDEIARPKLTLTRTEPSIPPNFRRVSTATSSSFQQGGLKNIQTRLVDRQDSDRRKLSRKMCDELDRDIDMIFAGRAEELDPEDTLVHPRREALSREHMAELTEAMILAELSDVDMLTSAINSQLELDDREGALVWDFQRERLEKDASRLHDLLANRTKIPALESEWLRDEIWGWIATVTRTLAKAQNRMEELKEGHRVASDHESLDLGTPHKFQRKRSDSMSISEESFDTTTSIERPRRPSVVRRAFTGVKKWFKSSTQSVPPMVRVASPTGHFARRPSLAY